MIHWDGRDRQLMKHDMAKLTALWWHLTMISLAELPYLRIDSLYSNSTSFCLSASMRWDSFSADHCETSVWIQRLVSEHTVAKMLRLGNLVVSCNFDAPVDFWIFIRWHFKVLLVVIHVALSSPQFSPQFFGKSFGQSFSSSSFTGPNGQVITSSVYQDTQGNRLVNGQQVSSNQPQQQQQQVPIRTAPPPAPPVPRPPVQQAQTSGTAPKKNAGAYVPDDRGKYKGNWTAETTKVMTKKNTRSKNL